jgi:rifampicin phosphotransferase
VFRRAGAIVADTGSVLSHTAIVAREFALPAVVAAADATSNLVDGEEVTVDGTRGDRFGPASRSAGALRHGAIHLSVTVDYSPLATRHY